MLKIDPRYLDPHGHGLSFRSPVVRRAKPNDKVVAAADYKDQPARLTEREAEFCKLLIDVACQLGSASVPVVLDSQEGTLILDKGCIKFAEHRGFIRTLQDDENGIVSRLELNFAV